MIVFLVQSYGIPSDRPVPPPRTSLYNKFVGGLPSTYAEERLDLRNIRVGRPATAHGLHIGEVVRFGPRTFIYIFGGRKTNTPCSAMRVWGGHHEGRNGFAPGCVVNPTLPKY